MRDVNDAVHTLLKLNLESTPPEFNDLASHVHQMQKNDPQTPFYVSYLSGLFTTGGHVHVDLIGEKRRLSLGVAGVTSAVLGGLTRAY